MTTTPRWTSTLGLAWPGLGHLLGGAVLDGLGLMTLSALALAAATGWPQLALRLHAPSHPEFSIHAWLALVAWILVAPALWHRAWLRCRSYLRDEPPAVASKRPGPWRRLARSLAGHRSGRLGLYGVLAVLLAALLAPMLAPFDPLATDTGEVLGAPDVVHLMGTDEFRRDLLSRVLYGARVSLGIGFAAVAIATSVGSLLGAAAGYLGGATDRVVVWLADLLLSLPRLVLILAVMGFWHGGGARSLALVVVVLGLTSWMGLARVVRAETQALRERPFVQAARALGLGPTRIVLRHVLPNVLASIIVYGSLAVGTTILLEAALGFLGLGVPPPTPTWGGLVGEGRENIRSAWWLTVFPGLMIVTAVMSFNLLGEGLRDALDPRLREVP